MTIATAADEPDGIASGAWSLVAVLTACYLVSSLDRFVVNLLIQPMATSLGLSDVQITLLIGFAFTLFYSSIGLLLGALVDRYNRRLIIIVGVLVWTLATAATALSWNYYSLLAARIVVGAGEAALAPAAYSLIADAFPRAKLSRPTTLYFLGGAVGPGVSLVVGGLALRWAEQLNLGHQLGLLNNEPWRFVLLIAALPGLLCVIAVALVIRDPRVVRPSREIAGARVSLWSELRLKWQLYLGLLGGTTALAIYINGIAAWWPTQALRSFGWPLKDSGVYFGMALAAGAVSGILASGSIGTALMRRFGDAGNGIALTGLSLIAAPVLVGAPFFRDPVAQLVATAFALALAFAINGLAPVGCQIAAGPAVRGRVAAFYVASTTIVGAGFGPVAVAALGRTEIGSTPIGLAGAFSLIGLFCAALMILGYARYLISVWRRE